MITGLNHITLGVKNIEVSFVFYRDVLNFKPLCKWDKGAYFLAGDTWVCLNLECHSAPQPSSTHYAFSVAQEDFESLKTQILSSGAKIYKENTSPGDSLYFLDPDGHQLEIHGGDWRSRLNSKKENLGSWENVEWFV